MNQSDLFFADDFAPGTFSHLRAGMEELLASIAAGRYDHVLVWEVPRLLRDEMELEAKERPNDRVVGSASAASSATDHDAADDENGAS